MMTYFIRKYLEARPMFLSIIRSKEAALFEKHKKYFKGRVLDYGCGDGFFAETVFGKNKIDVDLDLETSRAKAAEKKKIYRKVAYYDGRNIPYPDYYFSTVISNCVLEHIPSLDKTLAEIKRVLRPGGYFITSVMTNRWEDYLVGQKIFGKIYLKFMRKTQEHHNLLSKEEWVGRFKKAGFRQITTDDYLTKKQSAYIDLFHYLSFPSLLTYKLLGRWVIWPKWYKYFFVDKLIGRILAEEQKNEGAALFISCKN